MNIRKRVLDLLFEWDEKKAEDARKRHHISFEDACQVFGDPNLVIYPDKRHGKDEERFIALGKVGKVILLVYTERGDAIRIISARVTTKRERNAYYGHCAKKDFGDK